VKRWPDTTNALMRNVLHPLQLLIHQVAEPTPGEAAIVVEVRISVQDVVFRRVGDYDLSRQSCGYWKLDLDRTASGERE
jgi:hypothetical protein